MAKIVLVHGIAQQHESEQTLSSTQWLPALAGGVSKWARRADASERERIEALANRIYRDANIGDEPRDLIDAQVAYYGDLFLADTMLPIPQTVEELQTSQLPPGATDGFVEELGTTILKAAADDADVSDDDRLTAEGGLDVVREEAGKPQGYKELVRPALNFLAGLDWFSGAMMRTVVPLVWSTVTQVSQYMFDNKIRTQAQQRLLELIDEDTELVIGHSLGSVVAYEALHNTDQPTALITLGSPLGLKNIIWGDKLQVWPAHTPASVTSWYNFAAKDDLVAARLDIAEYFPPADGRDVTPISHIVDTGGNAHNLVHYLTQPSCGQAVSYALS